MANAGRWSEHVWFKKETTWGTAVTPDIWLPQSQYGVMAKPTFYVPETFTGVRQMRAPNMPVRTDVAGTLVTDMWAYFITSGSAKSVAQHLVDLAWNQPNSIDLDSATFAKYDPNDEKEHKGVRVNSCTISGSVDQGAIRVSLELIGKQESVVTAPTLVATTPHYKPMMFHLSTFALGGSAIELRSFELTINNNLQSYFNNSQWASLIAAGRRMVTFKFSLFKTDNTYDALRRAVTVTDRTAQLVLKGIHDGSSTNTYTTCTIDIDRSNFAGADEAGGIDELWQQSAEYVVLKPNTTDNQIDITWGTV